MTTKQTLQRIMKDYGGVSFVPSDKSWWDPHSKLIYYNATQPNVVWSVLHELGHMKSRHSSYKNDLELLMMESEAWAEAKILALTYDITIDTEYIEDCLDSYRDWLHKRSACTKCGQTGVQKDSATYACINCHQQWRVSKSRFCRSYRIKTTTST